MADIEAELLSRGLIYILIIALLFFIGLYFRISKEEKKLLEYYKALKQKNQQIRGIPSEKDIEINIDIIKDRTRKIL